jgi:hypothetical protein
MVAGGRRRSASALNAICRDENKNDNFRFLEVVFEFFSIFRPKQKW